MTLFQKVTKGESWRIPYAEEWNAMLDAGVMARRKAGAAVGSLGFALPWHRVLIKNTSGTDVPLLGVLGFDSPRFSPTDNLATFRDDYAFTGVEPDEDHHFAKFVIATEPIADGKFGEACIGGIIPVKVDVGHYEHDYADVKNADVTMLESGWHGSARILWKETGTGTKWAVVSIHHQDAHEVKGTADGDITAGSSGDVTVYKNGSPTSDTITAHLNWMHGSEQVSDEKQLLARWFRDEQQWVIVAAECED